RRRPRPPRRDARRGLRPRLRRSRRRAGRGRRRRGRPGGEGAGEPNPPGHARASRGEAQARLTERAKRLPTLITGAAGNLGTLLARHLAGKNHSLRLMFHQKPLAEDLASNPNVAPVRCDLSRPETVGPAVEGVDAVVHLAGILFRPRPERFLPETNARWFSNLVGAAVAAGVGKLILVSFPHVEGPTSPDRPATGRLDREPISVHARTRLAAEGLLFEKTAGTRTAPVVLRLGMVYGRSVLMIDAARWLARRRLLGVWKEPTLYQLISIADYLAATEAAITKPGVHRIYHLRHDRPSTL